MIDTHWRSTCSYYLILGKVFHFVENAFFYKYKILGKNSPFWKNLGENLITHNLFCRQFTVLFVEKLQLSSPLSFLIHDTEVELTLKNSARGRNINRYLGRHRLISMETRKLRLMRVAKYASLKDAEVHSVH